MGEIVAQLLTQDKHSFIRERGTLTRDRDWSSMF